MKKRVKNRVKKRVKRGLSKKYLSFILLGIIIFIVGVSFYFIKPTMSLTGFTIYESQPDSTTGKDTYIIETSNNSYGSDSVIKIGNISGYVRRGLIEFNLSSIPSANTISSAKMQIYVSTINGGGNRTISLYRITSAWNETTAGWYNRTGSSLWTKPGGDNSSLITSITITNDTGVYYNFTITSTVQNWINGSYNNYGMLMISGAGNGNYTYIDSSNSATEAQRPKIIIDHTTNAVPTINNISVNSNATNLINIGNNVTFTINWTDLENNNAQVYVCNSTNITFESGCIDRTFCNSTISSTNPVQCSYTTLQIDNRTSSFWVKVCDSYNCSLISSTNYFYINHFPNATIIHPNGGEIINQSLGNYNIEFNVSDADDDALIASIYYGVTQGALTNAINASVNLTNACTDDDSKTSTTNNCLYSWNSSRLNGEYYLTIIINDSYTTSNDSSDSSFEIRSVIDSESPNITAQWIENVTIYSGRRTQIYANVTDANLQTVWFEINTSTVQNTTMTNTSILTYNASFLAPAVGTYQFKVYANDTMGNKNNSMPWQTFNVTKPGAITQNEVAPSTAFPYHVIKVKGELNASDSLRDVYAYLNVPDGFTFLTDYPQNSYIGNFSVNQTKNATWFLSTPITETTYTLNITYTDYYSNVWNSSNDNVQVNSTVSGTSGGGGNVSYEISIAGYPEVETAASYYAEAYFKADGLYSAPDSMFIKIYDAAGNLTVGPAAMTQKSTGIYTYSYTIGSSVAEGQWQTVVNASKSPEYYIANQFFKVVGGVFDVRNITIINSTVNHIQISVITENTGSVKKDIIMVWNLTREDTGASLDSEAETISVEGNSERVYTINPNNPPLTTYVGQVRITFLGHYSGTEIAGAYKIFSTVADTETPVTPPPAGPGGGGGGGAVTLKKSAEITADKEISLAKNIEKIILVSLKNTGETELTNITLSLQGLDKIYYTISPLSLSSLKTGKTETFSVKFLMTDFINEKEFNYTIKTNELTKKQAGKIIMSDIKDYFLKEIQDLKDRINSLKQNITDEVILSALKNCENILNQANSSLNKEEFINTKDKLDEAKKCIDDAEKGAGKPVSKPISSIFEKMGSYWIWIVILILVLIIITALSVIIYIIYRKLKLVSFIRKEQALAPIKKKEIQKEYFDKKISDINKKLSGKEVKKKDEEEVTEM